VDRLTDIAEFAATTFVVIDFEATTPRGRRPEPIEVAAMAIRVTSPSGPALEVARFSELIRPPDHAPITAFDTGQTGITPEMVADRPDAREVLAELDAHLTAPPYLLVAHNAPTEAGLLYDYRDACPTLAHIDLLDTVPLARAAYPELPSHRLDVLMQHLAIATRPDRHRALADVEITAQLFTTLVRTTTFPTLSELRRVGLRRARANEPSQESLFDDLH